MSLKSLFLFLAMVACASIALATDFSVAPSGNDANPGTREKPFASLQRARDAIRELKRNGPLKESVTVTVHGGTYRMTASLAFGAEDSGAAGAPIVWQAAPGEEVRLSGAAVVPPEAFQVVTEAPVLERLDAAARGQVMQASLQGFGVEPPAEYPELFRGVPAVPEIFFNDQRMTLARWPNEGWATIAKIVDSGAAPDVAFKGIRPGTFEYSGDRPSRWNVEAGTWLLGYWCFDWYEETIKIQSISSEKKQITLARPAQYGIKQGNPAPRRFRAVNLLAELDQPGEYFLDRAGFRLFLWPPAAISGARIALSTLNGPIVALNDVEHLTLRGFIVETGLGDGITVSGGADDRIEKCIVRNTRALGINLSGGTGHRIDGCEIHDTGTGGISLGGGDRKTLAPGGHEALNNHIWRFSQHQLTSAYGIGLGGVGNRAAHNHLHDAPHQAIYVGGNDHVVEYNIIHDVCTETDDCGALYKGRNPSCRGNIIRYNFWHDIGNPMGHGTAAIYFDDGDGGDTVFGNMFLRCGHPGRGSFGTVFSHGGHDNVAENNIFIDCKRALGSAPWNDNLWKATVQGGQDCNWTTLLLKDVDITKPPYTTRYPALVGFMDPQPGQVRVNRAKNNVLVRCEQATSGNWTHEAGDHWGTDQDPGFVDAAQDNYQLKPDAEIFKHLPDFKPIPFDQMGPQPESTK